MLILRIAVAVFLIGSASYLLFQRWREVNKQIDEQNK